MKRSKFVPLILIGFASSAMTGCSEPVDTMQDRYRTQAECLQDWGNTPADCKQSTYVGGGGGYVGPRYYWNHGVGPVAVSENGTHTQYTRSMNAPSPRVGSFNAGSVSRGGFGSFGGRSGSSGG